MSAIVIATTVARDSLLAIPTLAAAIQDPSGYYKIFWESVPEGVPLPYITISHIIGGWESKVKENSHIEISLKICGHTTKPETAELFATQISKLHLATPTINSPIANYQVSDDNYIREWIPVADRYQNTSGDTLQLVGGIYEFFLVTEPV